MKIVQKIVLTALVAVFACVQSYALEKITAENYADYGFTAENYSEYLDYYAIATAEDLADFRDRINYSSDYSNAVVVADITINERVLDENGELRSDWETAEVEVWKPLSQFSHGYNGTFDGGNHTISGLYVTYTYYVGLFGYVGNGFVIKNVRIVDSYFKGDSEVGGLCGSINGSGKITIENCHVQAYIYASADMAGGLYGGYAYCVDKESSISNCSFSGIVKSNGELAGGICSQWQGTISNCENNGNVYGSTQVGGIAGYYNAEDLSISDCVNNGAVTASGNLCGGIVGNQSKGNIVGCGNIGTVTGNNSIGGIVGKKDYGDCQKCYNMGKVVGQENVGGIGGEIYTQIQVCANAGEVSGSTNIGGIAGYTRKDISDVFNVGKVSALMGVVGGIAGTSGGAVSTSYNAGIVMNNSYTQNVGALCGICSGSFSKCFYDTLVCPFYAVNNSVVSGATGYPTDNMYYLFGVNSSIWNLGAPTIASKIKTSDMVFGTRKIGEYPVLKDVPIVPESIQNYYNVGDAENPDWQRYTPIYSIDDFEKVRSDVENDTAVVYVVMCDISQNENYYGGGQVSQNVSWKPIGSNKKPFKGVFVGNDKIIRYLCNINANTYNGLFGYVEGATIKDVILKDCKFEALNYVGAIAVYANNSTIQNCVNYCDLFSSVYGMGGICAQATSTDIINCHNYGELTASESSNIGGICGYVENSNIIECSNNAAIEGGYVGGIFSYGVMGRSSKILKCRNTGSITSSSHNAAGIVAWINGGVTIENCINEGRIVNTGSDATGGIIGSESSGNTVRNCLNIGEISAVAQVGAICGKRGSLSSNFNYYDKDICQYKGIADNDSQYSAEGLTTSALASDSLPNGFDETVWGLRPFEIKEMKKYKYYPYLKCFGEDSAHLAQVLNCYDVSFDFNGGTTTDSIITFYTETEKAMLPDNVEKDGCTFVGWYSNPNYTSLEYTEIPTTETGIKSYYAKWIANTYDVVLDADGGTIEIGNISSYTYGYGAILPTAVSKNGYTFKGWYPFSPYSVSIESYPSESKMSVIKLLRVLNPSLTLAQAKAMSELPFPIVVEAELDYIDSDMETFILGMEDLGAEISVAGGLSNGVTLCDVVLESMDPSSKINLIKKVRTNLGVSLSEAKDMVENLPTTIAVDFDYDEAMALINELTNQSSNNVARVENIRYEAQSTSISITDFGTKLFRAKWVPKTYSVRLEVNGGTNTKSITEYTFGDIVELPTETDITRTGFTFEGWYSNSNYDGDAIEEISDSDFGDKVFYAKWSANMYEINLDANEGTINSGRINSYTFGDVIVLPIDVTRDGYDFKGWFTIPQDDADEDIYEPIIQISASDMGDKDLYAWWTPKKYTITLHTSGGTIPEGAVSEYSFGTTTQLPTNVELDGYTFKGWYANSYLDGPTVTEIESTDFGNKQFWARWSINCQIGANADVTNASCYGLSDGAIEVTATNVVEPVTYQWVGMESTKSKIETLPAGNYSVVITDYRECTTTKTFTVSQPAEILASIDTVENPRCDAESRIILKSEGDYTYLWSNGSTEKDLIGAGIGNYEVTVTEPTTGCSIKLTQALEMSIKQPEIALVTVSKETGNNLVVWVRENTDQIDYYTIYRETSEGNVFEPIATVNYSELSVYEDEEADAADRQWSYKISATDYCGNETALSAQHTTLHLQPMPSLRDNIAELSWKPYVGIDYSSFYIIRETKVNDYTFIDTLTTLPSTLKSYSAELPTVGKSIFYVGIKLGTVISPLEFLKAESGPFSIALSNIAEAENEETFINNLTQSNVEVYAVGHTINVINAEGKNITIYDNTSRKIAHTSSSLSTIKNDYEVRLNGVYYVIVDNESFAVVVK